MAYFRRSKERGRANFEWLDSRHSFSFGNYHDPRHMGFSVLRVINDDIVEAGAGFDSHGHADMEIITYVLHRALVHKDSTGKERVLPAGEVQLMSAGTGIVHSEFNASDSDEVRFLQIWILPSVRGIEPGYQQKRIEQMGALTELVTPDGRNSTLEIHQDASLSRVHLAADEQIVLDPGRRSGYLHLFDGTAVVVGEVVAVGEVENAEVHGGDGLGLYAGESLNLLAGNEGLTALWFDLPPTSRQA